jgi:hypothetical protein
MILSSKLLTGAGRVPELFEGLGGDEAAFWPGVEVLLILVLAKLGDSILPIAFDRVIIHGPVEVIERQTDPVSNLVLCGHTIEKGQLLEGHVVAAIGNFRTDLPEEFAVQSFKEFMETGTIDFRPFRGLWVFESKVWIIPVDPCD